MEEGREKGEGMKDERKKEAERKNQCLSQLMEAGG